MRAFEVTEQSSARYQATLLDEAGDPVPLASLLTLRLWLYDVKTGAYINSRDDQDVLNTNDVTYAVATGIVTWAVRPEDTVIVGSGRRELHKAVFEATWGSGDKARTWEVSILVTNLVPIQISE
jgi:hypothetical protein